MTVTAFTTIVNNKKMVFSHSLLPDTITNLHKALIRRALQLEVQVMDKVPTMEIGAIWATNLGMQSLNSLLLLVISTNAPSFTITFKNNSER